MAKIIIENHRGHDITLSHHAGSITVPAAKENSAKRDEIVPGKAEADEAVVADLRKKSPVVEHYFSEGWLRTTKRAGASGKADDSGKTDESGKSQSTDGEKK